MYYYRINESSFAAIVTIIVRIILILIFNPKTLMLYVDCRSSNNLTVLRHVQLIFRNADRSPLALDRNEPFYDEQKYWPNGFGQLTKKGRAKAFRLGQLLRMHYDKYLGQKYSVREVYVRSSPFDRCVETAQLIMAGCYPPKSNLSRWNINSKTLPLSELWQPAPIQTYIPANDDSLLLISKSCPEADKIKERLNESKRNIRLLQRHQALLDQVGNIVGREIDTIQSAAKVHENLKILHENNYYWYKWDLLNATFNWTEQIEIDAITKLRLFELAKYRSIFDDDFLKKVRAGELLSVIGDSFQSKRSVHQLNIVDERNSHFVLYSTHDDKLAAILQTLNIWNQQLIPYLATIMFELHQSKENSAQYYVQVWYLNETDNLLNDNELQLYRLDIPGCDHDELDEQELMCPLDDFLNLIQQYEPPKDWNNACGLHSELTAMISVNILILIVNLTMMFFLLMSIMYVCSCINHRNDYERLR